MRPFLSLALLLSAISTGHSAEVSVKKQIVDDQKAVIATVEPIRQLLARARIGGTIIRLNVREGDRIDSNGEVAMVVDAKLALQMQAMDERIKSLDAQRAQARIDYERVAELLRRGVSTKTQLDQAKTGLDVAERQFAAMRSDRDVIVQQASEGVVRAPAAGRVLSVPVSEGRVVLPGETIATLAEDRFILRLALPERHARSLRAGDKVSIAARGEKEGSEGLRQGTIRLVYPEIQGGRVIADVAVEGLGDYFVGERTRVYVSTGSREAILIPQSALFRRAGVTFVKLAGGFETVVQPGEIRGEAVEILSGLVEGDTVVTP